MENSQRCDCAHSRTLSPRDSRESSTRCCARSRTLLPKSRAKSHQTKENKNEYKANNQNHLIVNCHGRPDTWPNLPSLSMVVCKKQKQRIKTNCKKKKKRQQSKKRITIVDSCNWQQCGCFVNNEMLTVEREGWQLSKCWQLSVGESRDSPLRLNGRTRTATFILSVAMFHTGYAHCLPRDTITRDAHDSPSTSEHVATLHHRRERRIILARRAVPTGSWHTSPYCFWEASAGEGSRSRAADPSPSKTLRCAC